MSWKDGLDSFAEGFGETFIPLTVKRLERQAIKDEKIAENEINRIKNNKAALEKQRKQDYKWRTQAQNLQDEYGGKTGVAGLVYQRLKNGEKLSAIRSSLEGYIEKGQLKEGEGTGYGLPPVETTTTSVGSSSGPYVSGADLSDASKSKKLVAGFLGLDADRRNKKIQETIDAAVGTTTTTSSGTTPSTSSNTSTNVNNTNNNKIDSSKTTVENVANVSKESNKATIDVSPQYDFSKLADETDLNKIMAIKADMERFAKSKGSNFETYFPADVQTNLKARITAGVEESFKSEFPNLKELGTQTLPELYSLQSILEKYGIDQAVASIIPKKFKDDTEIVGIVNDTVTNYKINVSSAIAGRNKGQQVTTKEEFMTPNNINRIINESKTIEDIDATINVADSYGIDKNSGAYKSLLAHKALLKANEKAFDAWPKIDTPDTLNEFNNFELQIFSAYGVKNNEQLKGLHDGIVSEKLDLIKSTLTSDLASSEIKEIAGTKPESRIAQAIIAEKRKTDPTWMPDINFEKDVANALKEISSDTQLTTLADYQKAFNLDNNTQLEVAMIIAAEKGLPEIVTQLGNLKITKKKEKLAGLVGDDRFRFIRTTALEDELDIKIEQGLIPADQIEKERADIAIQVENELAERTAIDPTYASFVSLLDNKASNLDAVVLAMKNTGAFSEAEIQQFEQAGKTIQTNDAEFWKDPSKVTSSNWRGAMMAAEKAGMSSYAHSLELMYGEKPFDIEDIKNWNKNNASSILVAINQKYANLEPDDVEGNENYNNLIQQLNTFINNPNNMTKEERNIAILESLGISNEKAKGMVTGQFKYITDPDGAIYKIDKTTGQFEPLILGFDPDTGLEINPNDPTVISLEPGIIVSSPNLRAEGGKYEDPKVDLGEASTQFAFGIPGKFVGLWNFTMDALGASGAVNKSFSKMQSKLNTASKLIMTNLQTALPGRESKFLAVEFKELGPLVGQISGGWVTQKNTFLDVIELLDRAIESDIQAIESKNASGMYSLKKKDRNEIKKVMSELQNLQALYKAVVDQMNLVEQTGSGVGSATIETSNEDNSDSIFSVDENNTDDLESTEEEDE